MSKRSKRGLAGGLLLLSIAISSMVYGSPNHASGSVNFTFEAVDVQAFVKLIGEMTGRRFVIGDDVQGTLTVVSPRVAPEDVYPLFLTILESTGYSVREQNGVYHLVPLPGHGSGLASVLGSDDPIPDEGVFTKVFRLTHVSASEVRKLLEPRADSVGPIRALEETNHLVVTDSVAGIRRIEALLKQIDQPGLARMTAVVPLRFSGAEDMARQLNQALAENMTRAQRLVERLPARRGPQATDDARTAMVVPVPHSNRLILVGTQTQVDALRELIAEMDVDVPSGHGRMNAIFLSHLSAEEAADNISALLQQGLSGGAQGEGGGGRRIAIQASPSNNALLVDAGPGDFEVVKRLIEQLDRMPEQVHIGVVIMEVSHGDGLQFGVDFAAADQPSGVGDSVLQGSMGLGDAGGVLNAVQQGIFPRGLSVGVAHGSSRLADGSVQVGYPGLLNIDAFRSSSRFKVLSETSLQSQNNREASVSVVNEIPVLKSEITGGSGTARDVIQNIERMDVGVKLRITPHFIPGGKIRMVLNPSIEAVIDSGGSENSFTPTIAKREVETTVTVEDGRTIVIAGLTRRDERESERRVPFLGAIPLAGWLFRRTERINERTDLLILVTPTVVSDTVAAAGHQRSWERKTGLSVDGQD